MDKQELQHYFDEYLERIRQSGKKESSDIAGEVKLSHSEIKFALDEIKKRLDTANGYTAKHEQRLNQLDVLNAQTTLSQVQIMDMLKELRTESKGNTDFRLKADGSLATFKWLFGFLGVGNIAMIVKIFLLQ